MKGNSYSRLQAAILVLPRPGGVVVVVVVGERTGLEIRKSWWCGCAVALRLESRNVKCSAARGPTWAVHSRRGDGWVDSSSLCRALTR